MRSIKISGASVRKIQAVNSEPSIWLKKFLTICRHKCEYGEPSGYKNHMKCFSTERKSAGGELCCGFAKRMVAREARPENGGNSDRLRASNRTMVDTQIPGP